MSNNKKDSPPNEKKILEYVKSSKLQTTDEYEAPPIILQVDDTIIGTLGNFSSTTGKAKSRKTFNISAIAAAALTNSKVLGYSASFPEEKNKVILIDTEQSKYHCKKVLDRIIKLSDLKKGEQPENFEFYGLRQYSPNIRIYIIEWIIKNTENIGLVIIDGIRDLAYDINSSHEATEVLSKLMEWTDKYNIHIHTVLHQNKTDNNSRGHLGTELNNKSESVLKITVPEKQKDISVIEGEYLRDKDFSPFAFNINEDALPCLVDQFELNDNTNPKGKSADPAEIAIETHLSDILPEVYRFKDSLQYGELWKGIKESYSKFGNMGVNKAKEWVQYYQNQSLIVKEGKNYFLSENH